MVRTRGADAAGEERAAGATTRQGDQECEEQRAGVAGLKLASRQGIALVHDSLIMICLKSVLLTSRLIA